MATVKQSIGKVLVTSVPFSPKAFSNVWFEIATLRTHIVNRQWPSAACRCWSARSAKGLTVNPGNRDSLCNWLAVDVRVESRAGISWDRRYGLPFADGSVVLIYASHVLEHLEFRHELPRLLRSSSSFRALEPQWKIRIVVPDVQQFLYAYTGSHSENWAHLGFTQLLSDMPTSMCLANHVFHQDGEHHFGFDFETLEWALTQSGLCNIVHS